MPSLIGKNDQKGVLCSAVPLPERMNGIEFGNKVGRLPGECLRAQIAKAVLICKPIEYSTHLAVDIFGIAKRITTLRHPYRADTPRPSVNVPKKMPADRPI